MTATTKTTGKQSQKRATHKKPNRKGLRLCVSCRSYLLPNDLVKVSPSGGRSAYCCRTKECLQQALGRKLLQRALKTPIPDATLQSLHEILDALSMA